MSSSLLWYPHVTVATIITQDDKYLMVYEQTENGERYNQPAGHLENNESLFDAAIRETKEETGYDITLTGVVRVNQYRAPSNHLTYLRVTFSAQALSLDPDYVLDKEIIEARWLSKETLQLQQEKLRSPIVMSDIEFFESHTPLPLEYVLFIDGLDEDRNNKDPS